MADLNIPDNPNTNVHPPGVSQDGVGGFLQGVGQFLTGSNNPLTNGMMIPAMATAAQQWHNADTYRDLGQQAADRSDPFGKYRGFYGDQLRSLYDDPSNIENTPGYKFTLNQALNATRSQLASQGLLGSAEMQNGLATQAAGLASQTWNQERNALMNMAGAQFDPANAGRFMMQGGQLAVDAQNGALASMFAPFGVGSQGYSTGSAGNPNNTSNPLTNPANLAAIASRFPGLINPQTGMIAPYFLNQDGSINWNQVQTQFDLNNQEMPYTDGTVQTPMEPFTPSIVDIGDSINDYVPIDDNNPFAGMTADDFNNISFDDFLGGP